MARLCAVVVGVLLAVMPALTHTCDFGCTGEAAVLAPPSSPAETEVDCPLHESAGADAASSAPQRSSHGSTPCDHDGHNQAVGADSAKVVRMTTHSEIALAPTALPDLSPVRLPASDRRIERPPRATSAVTTRPILRI